jgi:hypothetical protein
MPNRKDFHPRSKSPTLQHTGSLERSAPIGGWSKK